MADSVSRILRDGVTLQGEFAPAVMLHDSLPCNGSLVFLHFLRSLASNIAAERAQARSLVIVSCDHSPATYLSLLGITQKENAPWLQLIDCFSDPLGWMKEAYEQQDLEEGLSPYVPHKADINSLTKTILTLGHAALASPTKARFAVVLDSISSLLRQNSVQSVASCLSTLRAHSDVSSVMWLLHSDLHLSKTVNSFEYLSSTVVSIEHIQRRGVQKLEFEGGIDFYEDSHVGILKVRQKRRNGRVREQIEEYSISGLKLSFSSRKEGRVDMWKRTAPQVQFNLQLSNKEVEDRAKVVLPFEHQGNKETSIYNGRADPASDLKGRANKAETGKGTSEDRTLGCGAGDINYIRDSDDERPDSDEDPDEDLDV